ncbi:SDR family NAD(P)-dependent oxidoreductase [Halomarina rubra]|uniref:SDR family NAD(P)-dependent oxidoreductase n=1 Tax=Halomarina rubra TaxID=2071873 RepID=A0ABD6B0P6_9EURY|nr:SDR family NAD(P)-dependent oxidoreductase [Halomarina rubra]
MERAIVVGASSGIGRALAEQLAERGYEVGLAARRVERLEELGESLPTKAYVARMDVTETEEARERFDALVEAMGGVDLVVLSAGTGQPNTELDWDVERDTVAVNAQGFAALATAAMERFDEQGAGTLVGISSVAALFGGGASPAYSASKAFVSNYCDGLRAWAAGRDLDATVLDVKPGYVDTEMAFGDFWKCSPETAARQILRVADAGRRHVYVTRRWRLVGWVLRGLPDAALERVFS